MAVDSFVSVSGRLASAIAPCLSSVLNDLHAETLIGFELKDELVNGNETNAKKATKLVTELERSLKSDCNPEELLETICSVLKKQKESQLTQIADTLRTGLTKTRRRSRSRSRRCLLKPGAGAGDVST